MKCDMLTAAGRKFLCGPRGTGFAYVSPVLRTKLEPEFVDLHKAEFVGESIFEIDDSSARSFELTERNTVALIGLNAAVSYHLSSAGKSNDSEVYQRLHQEMTDIQNYCLISPGTIHSGILSF